MSNKKDTRPSIPFKPMTEKEKSIHSFLWLGSILFLFASMFYHGFFTYAFWGLFCIYGIHFLKGNIAQCFQRQYIKKALLYLPLLFIPKFLCEQLVAFANIWWLNLGISANYFFGSGTETTSWISFFITLGLLICLFLPCNYFEEYYFRKRWYLVAIWALLHLILGFSSFTLGEFFILCGLGIGFKLIYDKHGIQVSYPTHVFANLLTVFVPIILLLVGIQIF